MPKSAAYWIVDNGSSHAGHASIARRFDWTFSRADLERVLAKLTEREPRLALAA